MVRGGWLVDKMAGEEKLKRDREEENESERPV